MNMELLLVACALIGQIFWKTEAYVEIGIVTLPYQVNESANISSLTIYISLLNGTTNETAAVGLRTTDGKAIRNEDYIGQDILVEFQPNVTEGNTVCSYITILSDNTVEDKENFTVYLTSNNTNVFVPIYAQSVRVLIFDNIFDQIDVAITSSQFIVYENQGYIEVCVKIAQGQLERTASVYLSTMDGTANNITHYLPLQNAAVKFITGDNTNSSRCLNITILDNHITENTKYFTVFLATNDTGINILMNLATVNIEDSNYITVSFNDYMYNTSEVLDFVTLCTRIINGTLGRPITVYASSNNGTAIAGENFKQIQSYPLLFVSGKKQNDIMCFNISIIDDTITGSTNYFTVNIANNDTGVQLAEPTNATVFIIDNDFISVKFIWSTITTDESTGYAQVCVTIVIGILARNASVYLTTMNGTAFNSMHYASPQTRELRFLSGDAMNSTTRCVNITILNNMITEDTKYFNVSLLTNDTGVIVVEPRIITIAITNSDYIVVSLTNSTYNTSESIGYAMICAKIVQGVLGRTASVYLSTLSETATDKNFIQVLSYPLLFISGNRQNDSACCNITVHYDKIVKDSISFMAYIFSNDTQIHLSTPFNASVTISDSDYITVEFTTPSVKINESMGHAILCIKILTGHLERDASVFISTVDGNATSSTNYLPLSYAQVRFTIGDQDNTTRCVNVTVLEDLITNNPLFFYASLTTNDSAVILSPYNITVIIEDTDFVQVSLTASVYNTIENMGFVMVCAKIVTGILGRPVSVYISTMNGTATEGKSFAAIINHPISFATGKKENDTKCFNITVFDNIVTADAVDFIIFLSSNDIGIRLLDPSNATIVIADDDHVNMSLHSSAFNTSENMGFVTICADIIAGTLQRSGIIYLSTKNGTARDGRNFIGVLNYPLLFLSGAETSCYNITVIDDTIAGNTNFFTIFIFSSDTGLNLVTPTIAIVWVADTDNISVELSLPVYSTSNAQSFIEVCSIIVKGILEKSVRIYLLTINGTAVSGIDYYSVNTELVFYNGQRQDDVSCFNITILNDMIVKEAQQFTVQLYSNDSAVVLNASSNASVIINDINFVSVSLTSNVYNTSESEENLEVCAIILSGYLKTSVAVYISTANATSNDFQPIKDVRLWFYSDETENDTSCVNITIIHDMLTEMTQSMVVYLTNNNSKIVLVQPSKATVFIKDINYIDVGFNQSMYTTSAGGRTQLCIRIFSGTLNATVHLGTYMNGTSTVNSVFEQTSIIFTLKAGDGNGTILCEMISLLPPAIAGVNQYFNVTLLLLTTDITVYFKQQSAILYIYSPVSYVLSAKVVAALSTGIILLCIVIFILVFVIYMTVCVNMIKRASVKKYQEFINEHDLQFPLQPMYTSGKGDTVENQEEDTFEKLHDTIVIENEATL